MPMNYFDIGELPHAPHSHMPKEKYLLPTDRAIDDESMKSKVRIP